jgi:hypothetical protein
MKQAVWLSLICALPLALATISQGCGSNSAQVPAVAPLPPPDAPRTVTDLSQLAPGSAINPFGKREQAIARKVVAGTDVSENDVQDTSGLGTVRHMGNDKHPAEARLLNKKAAQFDMLSMRLLDQVLDQILRLQATDEISHLKLPTDLKWVIISATLDDRGVLKELVVDQHSGNAAVDRMVIAACKKGLYIHNPPVEALDGDGNYKVRFEARFENYASMDGEHWEFKTYLGLAIL